MSNKPNHRRDEQRRTEHGPRWENGNPGKGCNSTHVARARKKHKRIRARAERRTSKTSNNVVGKGKKLRTEDIPKHLRDAGVEIDEHGRLLIPMNSALDGGDEEAMTVIKGQDVSLSIDGNKFDVLDFQFTPTKAKHKRPRYVDSTPTEYQGTATLRATEHQVRELFDALSPPKPKGAWNETLAKRVRYGGRKGRRAARRLHARGLMAVHWSIGDGKVESAAIERSSFSVTMPVNFDDFIRENAIRDCGSTPCPKCGWQSPCCDHVSVDIGIGFQTGNHEYVCRKHGPFAFPNDGGEPVFQLDGCA